MVFFKSLVLPFFIALISSYYKPISLSATYYDTNHMHKSGGIWNAILDEKSICGFISIYLQNQCIIQTHTKPNTELK